MYKRLVINTILIVGIIYLIFTFSIMEFNLLKWDANIVKMFIAFTGSSYILGNSWIKEYI